MSLVAKAIEEKCIGCGLCADICIADAVTIKEWTSYIDENLCRGCGLCVADCPNLAMDLKALPRRLILGRIKALLKTTSLKEPFEPRILIFICDWLSRKGADLGIIKGIKYSSNIRATKLPCSGGIDSLFIFEAIKNGADGVLIVGCGEEDCNFIDSNVNAMLRMDAVKKFMEDVELEPNRFEAHFIPLAEARSKFPVIVESFINKVKELGRSPF